MRPLEFWKDGAKVSESQMTPTRRLTHFPALFWIITMLAVLLRIQNLDGIQHNLDYAYPIHQALMTIDRGVFPLTGQWTSVLFANPPLTGYILIPAVALTRSPIGAYLLVIVVNSSGLVFVYDAARMLLSQPQALIALFLMAVNPWVIEYSRATWVQALLPCLVPLTFWLLLPILLGTARHPQRRAILLGIVTTILTQTYLLAFLILAPISLLLLIFRRRIPRRGIVIGIGILAMATLLYGVGLFLDLPNTLTKLQSFFAGEPAAFNLAAWTHAVRLTTGESYALARGLGAPIQDWYSREFFSEILHYLILIFMFGGIGRSFYGLRKSRHERAIILLIWFFVPILALTWTSKPIQPFYLLLTLPAGYLLAAWGIGGLLRWHWGRSGIAAFATCFILLMTLNTVRFAENTLATPGAHQLGELPLGVGADLIHTLLPAETRGDEVFIYSGGAGDDLLLTSLAGEIFRVNGDVDTVRITHIPASGGTYLFFGAHQPPVGATDKLVYTFADGVVVTRYHVLPENLPTNTTTRSDKGISYLGWRAETPFTLGTTISILTYWRIDALPSERMNWQFDPFIDVYDSTGTRIASRATIGVAGENWRLGEVYIERLTVPIPKSAISPFRLEIGEYDRVHDQRALFTLPDGTTSAVITVTP